MIALILHLSLTIGTFLDVKRGQKKRQQSDISFRQGHDEGNGAPQTDLSPLTMVGGQRLLFGRRFQSIKLNNSLGWILILEDANH